LGAGGGAGPRPCRAEADTRARARSSSGARWAGVVCGSTRRTFRGLALDQAQRRRHRPHCFPLPDHRCRSA